MALDSKNCSGSHRFHVADVAVVAATGVVAVIAICLHCGLSTMTKHTVTDGTEEIKLENQKRNPHELV